MIDYRQVLLDLKTLVEASSTVYDPLGTTKFQAVKLNANDRDYVTMNMPMLDIRLKRAVPDARTNSTYYVEVILELEVAVFDLTSLDDAATIRDGLVNALQTLLQANPRFSSVIETTILGNVDFATGEDDKSGAFLSGAVMELHVFTYSDR